jgi:hypothetical protein
VSAIRLTVAGVTQRQHFRVTFVAPNGWTYQTTGQASTEAEAIQSADDLFENVERIGISDFLEPDGVTVRPPARLLVERVDAEEAGSGFGLVITDPSGNVTRK